MSCKPNTRNYLPALTQIGSAAPHELLHQLCHVTSLTVLDQPLQDPAGIHLQAMAGLVELEGEKQPLARRFLVPKESKVLKDYSGY